MSEYKVCHAGQTYQDILLHPESFCNMQNMLFWPTILSYCTSKKVKVRLLICDKVVCAHCMKQYVLCKGIIILTYS